MDREMRAELAAALALQLAWGADEALDDAPHDRRAARRPEGRPEGRVEGRDAPPAARGASAAPGQSASPQQIPTLPSLATGGSALAEAEALAAVAPDLAALREAIAGFGGLALRDTATTLVFADGNPHARLMLIGEAPGAEEDREGKPFVGASGRLLDRMLDTIGLDRHGEGDASFYVTNILVWRPPGNRNPTDSEVALSLPFLRRHIALIRPKLILMLGAVSVRSLTGAREGITRVRGRWFEVPVEGASPVPGLATLHPAYLLRNAGAKKDAWADLVALRERLDTLRQD
jgi:uracil-DNA glycosylase family 4